MEERGGQVKHNHGRRATPHRSKGRRGGALCELCTRNSNVTRRNLRAAPRTFELGLRRPLKIKGPGALTTPKSLPAYRVPPPRLQNNKSSLKRQAHPKPTGQHFVSAVHRGSLEPPHTKHSRVGRHYHPEGAARCPPIVPLLPLQNSRPLQNEGTSHREHGALTATRSCWHRLVLPHFYPVFTPFLSIFTPLLPPFYPLFTLFRFIVLPRFYPVFTLFLPRSAPSFLPPFYPSFTPLVKGKMPNLPQFYPVFTPRPVFTLSAVLPPFYPVLSTLRMPIPPFLPQG